MKYRKGLINRIQTEKVGWSNADIDSWIENKMAELKETCPDLWQFIKDAREEIFHSMCPKTRAEAEDSCPAEMTWRHVLLKLLELIEVFKAQEEIEELERLWEEKDK
jgi:hypothetical protein